MVKLWPLGLYASSVEQLPPTIIFQRVASYYDNKCRPHPVVDGVLGVYVVLAPVAMLVSNCRSNRGQVNIRFCTAEWDS